MEDCDENPEFLSISHKAYKFLYNLDEDAIRDKVVFFMRLLCNGRDPKVSLEASWNAKIQFKKEFGMKTPELDFSQDGKNKIIICFFIGWGFNNMFLDIYVWSERGY